MDTPEERLHDAIFRQPSKESEEELPTPTVQDDIDWSTVIENAQSEVEEVSNGAYYESEDSKQYIYEAVMQAVYGKDYFKWLNQNT